MLIIRHGVNLFLNILKIIELCYEKTCLKKDFHLSNY